MKTYRMQTPKEKATEILQRFEAIVLGEKKDGTPFTMERAEAKECAEICTEEIIGELYDRGIRETQYWYNVQDELKEL